MDGNSLLVWWLLGVPIVLAVIDRMTMGGSKSAGAGDGSRGLGSSWPSSGSATAMSGGR